MKNPKLTETATEDGETLDQISKLPDSLLVRIISLLPTTDQAFRTCLVSKRWQYLWTSIDNLTLICTYYKSDAEKFVAFVDYTFSQRTSSHIKKFHLEFWEMTSYNLHIDQWLSYVIINKVEHVVLNSDFFKIYMLPEYFCTCSSLITLDLAFCAFVKGVVISWNNLKTLKFRNVKLDDETMVKLLSGCPALEAMELDLFHGFHRLEINNSNLKRLKLESFWFLFEVDHDHSLEIVAPYLQHLDFCEDFDDFQCRLLNVSSLVSANLTFHIDCVSNFSDGHVSVYSCPNYHHVFWTIVQDYLKKLAHVTELTIGTWFAEVLFMLQQDGVQLPEMKCKCLTLKFQITKYNLYGVASLLRALPNVETLNIEVNANVNFRHCTYESSYLRKGDNINLESWISNFAFPCLKSVNVICSFGVCRKDLHDKLFDLSKFLLKNAMVLEKFVITAKRRKCYFCSKNCISPYSSGLAAKLLGCPRPSTNFMMTFHDESDFS